MKCKFIQITPETSPPRQSKQTIHLMSELLIIAVSDEVPWRETERTPGV